MTEDEEDASCVSIPLGGPIYVDDMVGPLTRTSDFEASVLKELEKLRAELWSDSFDEMAEEDTSVAELKIIAEEELVSKAFEEAFKDGEEEIGSVSQVSEEQPNAGLLVAESDGDKWQRNTKVYKRRDKDGSKAQALIWRKDDGRVSNHDHASIEGLEILNDASASREAINGSPLRPGGNGELNRNISKKRKRKGKDLTLQKRKRKGHTRNQQKQTLNESYIQKVEQIVKVKQKQDEDKAAAKLHSFNGSRRIKGHATSSSDRTDRMKALKSISSTKKIKLSNIGEHVPVIQPEVVVCIEVYHSKRTWVKTQEFLVLGCQPLTELRDRIYCLTDEVMSKAGQHDASGYFLIEEVFCNDLRDPSAIDYSKPILDWLRNSGDEAKAKWECIISGEMGQQDRAVLGSSSMSHLPRFKAFDMQKVRFCDLRFRLGAGYVYCHQGNCKHVIVVRDMRLIHPEDVHNRAAYPITTFQLKFRFRKCSVCKIYSAEKVTVDDKWAAENPCYFCKNCYYMLHYANGSLLYDDFSVYDYFQE